MGVVVALVRCVVAVALLCTVVPVSARAAYGERVALVIANDAYPTLPEWFARLDSLPNAANDASAISATLRNAKFHSVEVVRNASRRQMQEALQRFSSRAEGAAVALIYFAGHGIAERSNYLLPVDARLRSLSDVQAQAIPLSWVLDATVGARLRVIALDACRNNPFATDGPTAGGSNESGLVSMEPDDVLLIYAAAVGSTAQDGVSGDNSPFAKAFSESLQPGVEARRFAALVRERVVSETRGSQRPYLSANLGSAAQYIVSPQLGLERFGPRITSAVDRARAATDRADQAAALAQSEAERAGALLGDINLPSELTPLGVYRGEMSAGQPGGLGQFEYRDAGRAGQLYRGQFRNGLFEGSGTLRGRFAAVENIHEAEAVARRGWHQFRYAGEFRAGERSGYGVLQKAEPGADFDVYSGAFTADQATGAGQIEYADGRRYAGEVRNGVPHGWGLMSGPRGFFAVGRWENGRLAEDLQR